MPPVCRVLLGEEARRGEVLGVEVRRDGGWGTKGSYTSTLTVAKGYTTIARVFLCIPAIGLK